MRIGVYVGSFNPVHKGHVKVVKHLLDNDYLDKVLMIPTLGYWDKQNLIDLKHRINMLKIYENDRVIIDSSKSQLEYTYQVMREVRKEYLKDEIFLIIGSDNLKEFNRWKNVSDILQNKVLVLPRGNNSYEYIGKFKKKDKFIVVDDYKITDISSTAIRRCIREKKYQELEKYLDKENIKYIFDNELYKEND